MKLATCALLALAEAKLKLKQIEIPEFDFFEFDISDEKHHGLPDDNKAYQKFIRPTNKEKQYHGACFEGDPSHAGVADSAITENSQWRCALVNKKRANADKPRDFVCFPLCTDWTKKKQLENGSFAGCRLHAPITNPINGWAVCEKGKWVVKNKLKPCFCDLCDPADAQKQLRKQQKQGRHEDYGADFSSYEDAFKKDFISHTHQQIIVGSCGASCKYQPVGYQQGNEATAIPANRDPPTAVCDRKKKKWNFKDHCNCIDLCKADSPGLPNINDLPRYNDDLPARTWNFKKAYNINNDWIINEEGYYNRAELNCGDEDDILRVCGEKGLRTRDKRHYFCANGEWIPGADSLPGCRCEDNKKAKKSKDKHNKDKPKKNKKRPDVNGSDDRPNKPNKKEKQKHKKNKH